LQLACRVAFAPALATLGLALTHGRRRPPRPQSYLRNLANGAELYLVGTAHVSRKSAEEASALLVPSA
jgi:hypothetical protein